MAIESTGSAGITDVHQRQVGLYYPYIHFQDEEWLRLALLYWDGLGRIVPAGFPTIDSPMVRELQETHGFITNLRPSEGHLYSVASHFLNLISSHDDELRARYGIDRKEWRSPEDLHRLVLILGPKMATTLKEALVDARLARMGNEAGMEAVYLDPRLADVYIAALAEEMSADVGCQPITDDNDSHVAMTGLTVERLGEALLRLKQPPITTEEIEARMALVACRNVIPKGLAEIPLSKLLKFRADHREELTAFQRFVGGLTLPDGVLADRVSTTDREALDMHLGIEYERTLKPALDDLQSALWGIGVDTVDSAVSIGLSKGASAEGAAVFGSALSGQPMLVGAAIGLLTFRVFRSKRAAAREAARSPVTYLLKARETFSPKSLLEQLGVRIRQLALGT